ncbi:hypothetical protein GCM10009799_42330 [Nocardiopsis rhodophaea]|uniref:Uncharacterized protein n=1 Tax=Nocardiopsis rhodophaea TaxID=280238 RepID=A0ABP5EXL5_9ACTN
MTAASDPLLRLLRQHYGHRWAIRRTDRLWIATANDPDANHAPTVISDAIEGFVRELEDPPPRVGCRSGPRPSSA